EPEPLVSRVTAVPLIDPDKMTAMLKSWSGCHKPWRAGLPVFARLTVYDVKGKSRGQIRNWNWDELDLNSALRATNPTHLGITLLQVNKPTSVSNTPLPTSESLVLRWVDRVALNDAIATPTKTSAQGL